LWIHLPDWSSWAFRWENARRTPWYAIAGQPEERTQIATKIAKHYKKIVDLPARQLDFQLSSDLCGQATPSANWRAFPVKLLPIDFLQAELQDLHGQLKSLDESIRQIETRPATEADLEAVTSALQRLDPIWDVLYPEEQRRVLELLVDEIDVGKTAVTVQFRADGIEQIATELEPIGERSGRASTQ
jgi:hypothetical protein